jgi:hypothetical protein
MKSRIFPLLFFLLVALSACGKPATPISTPPPSPTSLSTLEILTIPENWARWRLVTQPNIASEDIQPPFVWLGADEDEANPGNVIAIGIEDRVNGMAFHGDPAAPQYSDNGVYAATLDASLQGIVIVSALPGTIQSFDIYLQPWELDNEENFALFSGRKILGEGKQDGNIYMITLEPLETSEDSLLVVSIDFDNPRARGDAVYVWRLNPADESATAPNTNTFSVEGLNSLPPETILLQLEIEPTFLRFETNYPFGRIPLFTLYAGGTVISVIESPGVYQQVVTAQLSADESLEFVQQVFDAGFTRLESYMSDTKCQPPDSSGEQVCEVIMDGAFTILRVRMPDGEFREIKIYDQYANDKAAFEQITHILREYTHPNAEPYIPLNATLFVYPIDGTDNPTVQKWPLNPDVLASLTMNNDLVVFTLSGDELSDFLAAVDRNAGDFIFEQDEQMFSTFLVPWLPGFDFTADISREFPQK